MGTFKNRLNEYLKREFNTDVENSDVYTVETHHNPLDQYPIWRVYVAIRLPNGFERDSDISCDCKDEAEEDACEYFCNVLGIGESMSKIEELHEKLKSDFGDYYAFVQITLHRKDKESLSANCGAENLFDAEQLTSQMLIDKLEAGG